MFSDLPTLLAKLMFVVNCRSHMMLYAFLILPLCVESLYFVLTPSISRNHTSRIAYKLMITLYGVYATTMFIASYLIFHYCYNIIYDLLMVT